MVHQSSTAEAAMRRIVVTTSPEGDVELKEEGQRIVRGQSFEIVVNGDCSVKLLEPSRARAGN